jgi:Kef-type K+ transport system membrane component KefB/mannitol/fructose-specific phosphotransferase system IIA component (Ntr-type)
MDFILPEINWLSLPVRDPVLIVAIVMLIILVSPLVIKRLKVPGLVGVILAGTIVGPSVIGLLERDATIILLGTVGLLYLMFMAGLSIDLNQFNRLRNRSLIFGSLSFLIPMGLAVVAGEHLLGYSIYASLLLGAIVGSHTLLAYSIANRLGITPNGAVTMTMGGTMITDSLSLFVLAIVAGSMETGITASFIGTFTSSVVLFLGVSLFVIPRLGRWFFRTMPKENDTEYIFLMAILFVTAWFADLAGLAPIIGAFLAGLLLNRLVPESSPLMNRIQFVGNALFIPFFLISVGMLVDVSVLIQLEVWYLALVFTTLVLVGKGLSAKLTQKLFKLSNAEGWVIFGLSSPQAAATLAVTLVGFEIGLFSELAVNAVVIMILITCLLGPWFVEKYGREVALQEAQKAYAANDAPQRILVPLANPTTAEALMDIAFAMRDKNSTEPVFPLSVVRDGNNVAAQVADSEKMLGHAVIYAAGADIPVNPLTRVDMNIATGINRAIKEKRVSNVIIGWNGENSAKQQIFGGVLDQLLRQSREMVMVCKLEDKISVNEDVYVAIPPFAALEPGFAEAMRYIKILVNQIGARLHVIVVEERLEFVRSALTSIEPEIKTVYHSIPTWSKMITKLDEVLEDESMFILMSSREGTISWRPGLDRIPGIVASRFSENNFIAVYPSEITPISESGDDFRNVTSYIDSDNIHIGIAQADPKQMVRSLIQHAFGEGGVPLEEICQAVTENSLEYTPEIIPGVAILDAHSPMIKSTDIFVGISEEGVRIPRASGPVHVLVVILNSDHLGIDTHFRRLNAVAKLFRDETIIKDLKISATSTQVLGILEQSGRNLV